MDRRVTSVELRPISLLTTAQVNAAVAVPETPDLGPDTVVGGLTAPNQYTAVTEGYYYPGRMTGSAPRVELYFTARPGITRNKTIRISGIHNLIDGSTAVGLGVSGDFITLADDFAPWDDRDSYNGVRHTPGENIASAVLFDPKTGTEYSDRKPLIVKSRIASTEATTTTAKITFTSTNYFKVNDVVYVEMPQSSPYFGIDGRFRVKEAGSNFITFDFSSAIASSVASAAVTEERYVYAVAQAAVRDGATWIDTRSGVDTVYVWKDIRWVTYSTGDVTKDTLAPSPVTELTATNENDTPDGNAIGLSRINLTWVAPTTNSDGTRLDDLIGYTIWWRQFESQEWSKVDTTGNELKWSGTGFEQGANAYFRVFARDSGGNLSTGVGLTHSVNRTPPAIFQPNLPIVTTYLGTIKVAYDDLTVSGAEQADTAKEVEVYFDRNENFVPGPDSYYGKFAAGNLSYIIIPGTDQRLSNGDGVDFYFRIIVRDIYGNITAPSDPPVSIRAKLSDIVTYDMIDVGTLTGRVIIGADIRTSDNPSATGGIILNEQQLIAYNDEGEETFRISADNGAVSIGDYLGKEDAAGLYLGQLDAASTYSTKIEANAIELKATNAAQSAADAQDTADESITRIEAGTITITKPKAVGAINEGVDAGNTTTINGGVIKTNTIEAQAIKAGELRAGVAYVGSIDAGQITAGSISSSRLTSTSLNADNITSGTIASGRITTTSISAAKINATNIETGSLTSRTVQTAGSGKRIVLDPSTNRVVLYEDAGAASGFIDPVGGGTSRGVQMSAGTGARVYVNQVGTTISGSAAAFMNLNNTGDFVVWNKQSGLNGTATIRSLGVNAKAYVFANASGVMTASTSTSGVSDARVKTEVSDSDLGLNFISELKPVKFKWVDGENNEEVHRTKYQYGLLAQDVRESLKKDGIYEDTAIVQTESDIDSYKEDYPDIADQLEENPILSLDYIQLTPILIKAVQEMSSKIDSLESEIERLKNGDK